jgi:hypothetical protein
MGLFMLVLNKPNDTTGKTLYQHPSWKNAGWLAPIQLDNNGNVFTAPAPHINVLDNPVAKQNQLQKIDAQTGEMKTLVDLPMGAKPNEQNPYGILGLTFYCEKSSLYVSSVAGSSRAEENGIIFQVDPETGQVLDKITGQDAFGLGICYIEGKRRLYFGKARTPDVYAVDLDKDGGFIGKPVQLFSLEGLGPRGDDKAKKISFTRTGEMDIEGYEFNFNLIAPTEKQSNHYLFRYDPNQEKWVFVR